VPVHPGAAAVPQERTAGMVGGGASKARPTARCTGGGMSARPGDTVAPHKYAATLAIVP